MTVRLTGVPLQGAVTPPASKSDAQRNLILAALANEPTRLTGLEHSEDISAAIDCLQALGARVDADGLVHPVKPEHSALLRCGESATTLRLLLPVVAALGVEGRFIGQGSLPGRPLGPLLDSMEKNGASFDKRSLPLTVSGNLRSGTYELPGNVSSQFVSGLLLALSLLDSGGSIHLTTPLESAGYVDMTIGAMERFGVSVMVRPDGFMVPGSQGYRSPGEIALEKDWSGAAFFLVAGATSGDVVIEGLSMASRQPDRNLFDILYRAGATIEEQPGGGIHVARGSLLGQDIDVSGMPDLVPVLAVLGMAAQGRTKLYNAARLRIKESDRLESTCAMVRALGGTAEVSEDSLIIEGGKKLTGGTVDGSGDHRIVMAAAIAAPLCANGVTIEGAQAADKSYPSFFAEYSRMGGGCDVVDDR